MRLFNKVAIVGTGLIGGSIALAIKKKKLAQEIVGVARRRKTLLMARKIGAIDKGAQDLGIIKGADLVILATPVNTIINLAKDISEVVDKKCIITDVGSTKHEIVKELEKIFPRYIGSHPLAGSEKRGVAFANKEIFNNSLCVLTPTKKTGKEARVKVKRLWRSLGARVILLTPDMHDMILSFTSHLPHLVAFSLIGTVPEKFLKFSSSGLKDTTRIAASESELWLDIFFSNRKNILKSIGLFQAKLSRIKTAINNKDVFELSRIIEAAKIKRETLE